MSAKSLPKVEDRIHALSATLSRALRELEKILPPYDFLFLDEPKLYDLGHYNECLMKR